MNLEFRIMRKRIVLIILFATVLLSSLQAQDEKLRLAVFDPTSSGTAIDEGTKIAVREIISSTFVNTGKYLIVERSLLDKIMKEQAFSNSGVVDDSQASELGKLAGANKVVLSVITLTGGRNMLSIKLIDVKTASVERQKTKIITSSELLDNVEPLSLELMGEKVTKTIQQPVTTNTVVTDIIDFVETNTENNDFVETSTDSKQNNANRHPAEPEMVFVQGGTFSMGCSSEQGDCDKMELPLHSVTVSNFSIGKYEVTQEQWALIMNKRSKFLKSNQAVSNINWNDVQKFITRLNEVTGKNYRLPTEAEWEYAARGGNKSKGFRYSGSNSAEAVAWFSDNSGRAIHEVGTKMPNELGIYDMSGNVWEWCNDWFGDYSSSAQQNPKGESSGSTRVLRGGSFLHKATRCRSVRRDYRKPGVNDVIIGFRLAL
jgi:formylglycine-generating enzyme required for sulfatase activity